MDDQTFNTKLNGFIHSATAKGVPSDQVQGAANKVQAWRTFNQTSTDLNGNGSNMNPDDFTNSLSKFGLAASQLGYQQNDIQDISTALMKKRTQDLNPLQYAGASGAIPSTANAVQGFTRGLVAAPLGVVSTLANGALSGVSDVASGFGDFISQFSPKGGASIKQWANGIANHVQTTEVNGANLGYFGNITPYGSDAATQSSTGLMTQGEAMGHAAMQMAGGELQTAAYGLGGEGAVMKGAAVLGAGAGLQAKGEGQSGGQAAETGMMTGGIAALFGVGAEAALGVAGSVVNKILRSPIGGKVMSSIGTIADMVKQLPTDSSNPMAQAAFDRLSDVSGALKSSMIQMTSDGMARPQSNYMGTLADNVREGGSQWYQDKGEAFDTIFNPNNMVNPRTDLPTFGSTIQKVESGIGMKNGIDMINYPSQMGGMTPEEKNVIQVQKDLQTDQILPRNNLVTWIQQLRGFMSRDSVSTASLQSHLTVPSDITGGYRGQAVTIADALRSDLKTDSVNKGLGDTFDSAYNQMKTINEQYQTKLKDSIFNNTQAKFQSDVVSGKINLKDESETQGLGKIIDPKVMKQVQGGLINEVRSQVNEINEMNWATHDPAQAEAGYQKAAAVIDKFVSNAEGTPFLSHSDRVNLLAWSSALKNNPVGEYAVEPLAGTEAAKAQTQMTSEGAPAPEEAGMAAQSTAKMREALQSGTPSKVPKQYFAMAPEEKSSMWENLTTPERASVADTIMSEHVKTAGQSLGDLPKNAPKEDVESALGGVVKSYTQIKEDAGLWNNLDPKAQTTIQGAIDALDTLSTLKGAKYKNAAAKIASSPIIASLGHPMMAASKILTGGESIVEGLLSGIEKISPEESERMERIMGTKSSPLRKTASWIRQNITDNASLRSVAVKGATLGGGGDASNVSSALGM